MKATMTAQGVVVLSPESELEAWALGHWQRQAAIQVSDPMRLESVHFRGSMLKVVYLMPEPIIPQPS